MPFFDRIIDNQLYLATQQCVQPYVQQRRVSSAPVPSAAPAAAVGPARAAGAHKSSLGSLVSPWSPFSGGGSGSSSSSSSNNGNPRSPAAYRYQPRRPQGSSPVDLFFTAPVGIPVRGRSGLYSGIETHAHLAREESSSSPDQFVTAPVGNFTIGADTGAAGLLPPLQPRHGNGSRPGSSDTDGWTFATASGGSVSGTFSGLDTTVDLTPSPPPSSLIQRGKIATHMTAAAPRLLEQQPRSASPASAMVTAPGGVSSITLQVQDLQRTRRFYEHVFGTSCLSSSEDGKSAALRLNNGALFITLRESPDKRRREGVDQGVLLSVPVDDVGEVCRRLRSFAGEGQRGIGGDVGGWRSAELVAGPRGVQVVAFSDPAGYRWQVGQEVEGS
ncbi:hypothetical protein F5883DRAFT_555504 [Diaporthe sp. PMI_573]|nr:hypothetical protein F5883DRAFT_555504 [Diaporthaceae sp. PMI_573]